MNVRPIACFAAVAWRGAAGVPVCCRRAASRRPGRAGKAAGPAAAAPAARYAALPEKLNQNTVTVISGNPNGTYLYLAYDMSAVLDDGNELRVLPVIGKGGYQNVMDVLHLRGVDLCITQSNIMSYLKKTGEIGPQHREPARLHHPALQRGDARPRRPRHQERAGPQRQEGQLQRRRQRHAVLDPPDLRAARHQGEEVNVGQADGYQMVKSGEIAATVLIAGKPTGSFAKFKLEPGMTLLPVAYTEALEQDYFPAKLTREDYPGLIAKGS